MLKSVQKNVFSSFTTSNNVIIVIFNCKVHDHLILNQHNQSITHLWGGGGGGDAPEFTSEETRLEHRKGTRTTK